MFVTPLLSFRPIISLGDADCKIRLPAFASDLGKLRGLKDDPLEGFKKKLSAEFYDQLNKPFNDWLANLRIDQEPDNEITRWKNTLKNELAKAGNRILQSASPRDIIGRKESYVNIDKETNR